jgi:ribonuclease P/MRP protein subunit RPP40
MPNSISSTIKIFADDTKIFRALRSVNDITAMQADIHNILLWSTKWQLPFNIPKCKILHYGKNNPEFTYSMDNTPMKEDVTEKDLGVTFDTDFNFRSHIQQIVAKANSRVGIIKRTFVSINKKNFNILYKSLVRPIIEYCSQVWSPYIQRDINEIEKVQHRATKLVQGLGELSYEDRLKQLNLPTLAYRRMRADILQTFRILNGFDNLKASDFFALNTNNITRGHHMKILKPLSNTKLRQHTFSQRVINCWNSLPDEAVNCETINSFKTALEKHWKTVPLKFDPLGTSPMSLHQ